MSRKIIIRIIIENRKSLKTVEEHILGNLAHQSSHEYPVQLQQDITTLKEKVTRLNKVEQLEDRICFILKEGKHYYDGQWERRLLITEIENYVRGLNLLETDELFFMLWSTDKIYTLNMIKELTLYKIEDKEKVLLIPGKAFIKADGTVQKQTSVDYKGFIFLCTVKEYWEYFKVYDLIMGFDFKQFEDFPRKALKTVAYKLCE